VLIGDAGELIVRGLVGQALTVAAMGVVGTAFCVTAQSQAKKLAKARSEAVDKLVEVLEAEKAGNAILSSASDDTIA
jgi:hypothetical protein